MDSSPGESCMHIVHGTWIPEDTQDFVQGGAFYLWVETDTPIAAPRKQGKNVHPRHLAQVALADFCMRSCVWARSRLKSWCARWRRNIFCCPQLAANLLPLSSCCATPMRRSR